MRSLTILSLFAFFLVLTGCGQAESGEGRSLALLNPSQATPDSKSPKSTDPIEDSKVALTVDVDAAKDWQKLKGVEVEEGELIEITSKGSVKIGIDDEVTRTCPPSGCRGKDLRHLRKGIFSGRFDGKRVCFKKNGKRIECDAEAPKIRNARKSLSDLKSKKRSLEKKKDKVRGRGGYVYQRRKYYDKKIGDVQREINKVRNRINQLQRARTNRQRKIEFSQRIPKNNLGRACTDRDILLGFDQQLRARYLRKNNCRNKWPRGQLIARICAPDKIDRPEKCSIIPIARDGRRDLVIKAPKAGILSVKVNEPWFDLKNNRGTIRTKLRFLDRE